MSAPIDPSLVEEGLRTFRLTSVGSASIREVRQLIDWIEQRQPQRFIRMEMGIPGLPVPNIAVEAEVDALRAGVAANYPPVAGIPPLKQEISRFIRSFLDITVPADNCFPTVGSLNGSYIALMVAGRAREDRNAVLFLDPGFPLHKAQARMVGVEPVGVDIYNWRGRRLKELLEREAEKRSLAAILYSNPNNPTWICLTEEELKIIGEFAQAHDVVVIEDLAYVGMDFRKDLSLPGRPPFQPTVARYTDQFILLVSSSKAFSYAGQRIGMMAVSEALWNRDFPGLRRFYGYSRFGDATVLGTLYATSAGVPHSAQYGLLRLLQATNDGEYDFISTVRAYGRKAAAMKRAFVQNGFYIVYDTDVNQPIGDGFYFTIGYPGFTGEQLIAAFLPYGISAISLGTTGSEREGLRACVSLVPEEAIPELERRLSQFRIDHPV